MAPTPEKIAELRETFNYNDPNGDGKIDYDEFRRMLDDLNAGVSEEEARIGFDEIDSDDDGAIQFDEFIDWWSER
ncbi:MAG TPA: EF-hand domain-containing protein [Woeseiaceae bacterium]|nr:EF-hand domain-containing protein [Woeseiaceae bacterium]